MHHETGWRLYLGSGRKIAVLGESSEWLLGFVKDLLVERGGGWPLHANTKIGYRTACDSPAARAKLRLVCVFEEERSHTVEYSKGHPWK